MEPIKETINNLMRDWGEKKNNPCTNNPENLFKKILTKRQLRHIKFNYFRKGRLGLLVDSSAWLYQLSLKKDDLLIEGQKNLSNLKEIYFRLGEVHPVRKNGE